MERERQVSKHQIVVRQSTVQEFQVSSQSGKVDLQALAKKARDAKEKCESSLAQAGVIAGNGWWQRMWNSGDLQKLTLDAVSHIQSLSEVNIALSAVCSDLASDNLSSANEIQEKQRALARQMGRIEGSVAHIEDLLCSFAPSGEIDASGKPDGIEGVQQRIQSWRELVQRDLEVLQSGVRTAMGQLADTQKKLGEIQRSLAAQQSVNCDLENQIAKLGSEMDRRWHVTQSSLNKLKDAINNNRAVLNDRLTNLSDQMQQRFDHQAAENKALKADLQATRHKFMRYLLAACLLFMSSQGLIVYLILHNN